MEFNLDTVEGRWNYLVYERKNKIKELEIILQGKDSRYKNNMSNKCFIESVVRDLKNEKQLLHELLTDDFYKDIQ